MCRVWKDHRAKASYLVLFRQVRSNGSYAALSRPPTWPFSSVGHLWLMTQPKSRSQLLRRRHRLCCRHLSVTSPSPDLLYRSVMPTNLCRTETMINIQYNFFKASWWHHKQRVVHNNFTKTRLTTQNRRLIDKNNVTRNIKEAIWLGHLVNSPTFRWRPRRMVVTWLRVTSSLAPSSWHSH